VHGVLLLDKPKGLSSNAALQKAKWLLAAQKAGHTGTLDPMATGLLPLCFGAATKFSQLQLDADKAYAATLKLGVTTTTGDAEGEVLERRAVQLTQGGLLNALTQFTGPIEQVPPMHSALKHEGKKLYELAREGVSVEREARKVTIYSLSCERVEGDEMDIEVSCSKGTYIRTLGEGIGEALDCGAHLCALRRTQTGSFALGDAITLDALDALPMSERLARLLSVDSLLAGWPTVELNEVEAARFLSGLRRRVELADAQQVRVHGPHGELLGSAHVKAGELIADRLLNPAEVSQILDQMTLVGSPS
jgi:tRNA pseudouridine55 synthase